MIEPLDISSTLAARPATMPNASARISIPPAPTCAACIVIPARDEAGSIERTLAALAAQEDLAGRPLDPASFEIVVLANNCRDQTASIARRVAERNDRLSLHVVEVRLATARAHVGYARRLAMDEACRRLFAVGRPRGLIATTDADTAVSPTWLAATLREVALGAEAVGGRILVASAERQAMTPPARSRFLRNVGYGWLTNEVAARIDPRPGDPWPCHEQFFGASLALTAQAYRAVGGLPPLASGEDAALADALRRADVEVRHSPAVRAHTSGRLDGRTPAGLAALLAGWSGLTLDDEFQLVPSSADVVWRATGRRALRDLWERARVGRDVCVAEAAHLADVADVPVGWLNHALLDASRFGPLLSEFEQRARWQRTPDLVDVREAIEHLRSWLAPYRRPGAPPPAFARHVAGLPFLPPARPGRHLASLPRPEPASPALEQVESVSPLAEVLAPPPQVA
jgi:cellulose synthase/poly-beta-1,6-N-acetylglucosamine synthase-like glycosyltransferase